MQLSYWKRYDLVFKLFSPKKIYNKLLDFARQIGRPFEKKSKRGRQFKIEPEEYVAYAVFEIISDGDLRDMELDSDEFFGKHLDHSTFGKNLRKVPLEYLRKLLQLTGEFLEKLLGHAKVHIPDSTKLSTDRYKEILYRGEPRKVKETFKLHAIVQRHPKKQMAIIMDGLATDAHVSDAEGAVRMSHVLREGDILPADRGYDYEKVYGACAGREVITNIKKQERGSGRKSKSRKRAKFYRQSYKKQRGIVEVVFGAIENAGATLTHYRNEDMRFKYGLILLIKHNINNILRAEAEKFILYFGLIRQTLFR